MEGSIETIDGARGEQKESSWEDSLIGRNTEAFRREQWVLYCSHFYRRVNVTRDTRNL